MDSFQLVSRSQDSPLCETRFQPIQLRWGVWPCPCHVHLLKGSVNLCVPSWQQGAQNFMTLDNRERCQKTSLTSQTQPAQHRPLFSECYWKQSALGLVGSGLRDYWTTSTAHKTSAVQCNARQILHDHYLWSQAYATCNKVLDVTASYRLFLG